MHVGFEKRDQIGARLRDDEVVHIEKLGDAREGRFVILVGCMRPVAKGIGWGPWYYIPVDVLGQDRGDPAPV